MIRLLCLLLLCNVFLAGVHIFQRIDRCNFDEDTGEVHSSMRYGYDGEDFLELDLDKLSWVALSPQAAQTKRTLETQIGELHFDKELLTYRCPLWLKISLDYGKSVLRRTDLPSVSLLQKTPSSPIRCHATGFYPYRAHLFWRKDGQETHEDVEHSDILPNNDGSFQMMTDLNVSSINIEDWGRFDCVFHFSSAADKVIIKLDKSVIKTNYVRSHQKTAPIVATVLIFGAVAIAAGIFAVCKIKKNRTDLRTFGILTNSSSHEVSF